MIKKLRAKIKGWRSAVWHSLVGLSGVALLLVDNLQTLDWSKIFTPTTVGLIIFGLGLAGILLRIITTTAIGQK